MRSHRMVLVDEQGQVLWRATTGAILPLQDGYLNSPTGYRYLVLRIDTGRGEPHPVYVTVRRQGAARKARR